MDKVAEIAKSEAEATENLNKVLQVCKKITQVRHQTVENEKEANILQVKLDQLKQECLKLEIEAELQKKQVEFQKSNVAEQVQVLQHEKEQLEDLQQEVWKETKGFINDVNGHAFLSGRDEAQKFLEMRAEEKIKRGLRVENLQLEGKIYALNSFKKFQEKRIIEMEKQIEMKQCKVTLPPKNQEN